MPKIFVPCRQVMTASKARQFGAVKILHNESDPSKPSSRMGLEPDRIFNRFARPLNTWEAGDMVLLDGPLIYNAVVSAIISCQTNTLRFLIWDKKGYIPKVAHLTSVEKKRTWKRRRDLRRVYAINNVHNIIEPASKHGKLVCINEEDVEDRPAPTSPRYVFDKISNVLKRTHRSDFLLLSGSKLENAIASAILAKMHGTVNYLIFHHGRKGYLSRTVNYSKSRLRQVIRDQIKRKS